MQRPQITDIWNSFRAKGDSNGSLKVCSQDFRLHGIIKKFFLKKKKKTEKKKKKEKKVPSAASHLGARFMPESPVKVAASAN